MYANKYPLSKKLLLLGLLILMGVPSQAKEDPDAGKTIFTQRCTSCHAVSKDVVGPALGNVDKTDNIEWIIQFVHGSQAMVKAGDKRAVELFNAHNQTVMPNHLDLSAQDIKNIFAYIDAEAAQIASTPAKEEKEIDAMPYPGHHGWLHHLVYLDIPGTHEPLNNQNKTIWFVLFVSMALGVGILLFSINIQSYVSSINEDDKEEY